MRLLPIVVAAVLATVILPGAPSGADSPTPPDGRGLAPYRFNPPPDKLTPSEEAAAQAYRQRLQGKRSEIERQKLRETPLGQEQLRETGRELDRIDRLLDIR